jgi:pimeloyl-ACP methyl ester carboxylesterase
MPLTGKLGYKGKTFLFLPGGNVDARCYLPLLRKLALTDSVYYVNFQNLPTKNIKETVNFLCGLITRLGTQGIILIGHSFGGSMANLLLDRMNEISRVILIDPTEFKNTISIPKLIFKRILRTFFGWLRYPTLFSFYLDVITYTVTNLITAPRSTYRHLQQSIHNFKYPVRSNKHLEKLIIIQANNDELCPLETIPAEVRRQMVLVDGPHDWIMKDSETSAKLIKYYATV